MPRELPRRELEHEPQAEGSYNQKESALKAEGLENTRRWTGVQKVPVTLGADAVRQYSSQFRTTVADLKALADFSGMGGARAAAPLKQRTQNARGDLAGFWNDVKQELASRSGVSGNPQADARLNTALDWLELAERQGGLGTWLEQWNDMLSSRWSWDMLADSVGKIKQGIEFCKEMGKEGFGDLSGLRNDPSLQNRTDLMFALDAIASEITRQADDLLSGNRLNLGKPLDAITERFKDVSPRAGIEGRLHSACENGNLDRTWARELPDAIRQNSATADVSATLKSWQEAADNLNDVVTNAHQASDEMQAVTDLDAAATQLTKNINDLIFEASRDWTSRAYDPDQRSLALHVYKRMATEIVTLHQQLSERLADPTARSALEAGAGMRGLSRINFDTLEPTKSVYYSSREFAAIGRLDEFWRQGKDYVDKAFRTTGGPAYNPGLADAFAQAVGQDLENLLVAWTKRKSGASYTLAWELIATLRNLKQRSETILANAPTQRDFTVKTLDAIADVITTQVQVEASST